jgi:MFS family permease
LRAIRQAWRASVGGLSPVFWVLWTTTLVNRLASFVGMFLALYLRQLRGFDEAQAGLIVGLFGLGSVPAAPLGGMLTDRIGRRATMLASMVLGGLAVVALALVREPVLLAGLAFACGAFQQLAFPAYNAALADVTPQEDRSRAYGLVYWAANLGLAVGFVIAGLVPMRHMAWLFLADAGTTFVCAALVYAKIPETRPAGIVHEPMLRGMVRVLEDRAYLGFVLLQIAALAVFLQFTLALPLDMADHGVGSQRFSVLMALNCLGVVALQPWLTPLLRRFDPSRLLAASAVLFSVGYGLNAVVSTFPLYLVGAAFWTVGEVVGFPAASTLVAGMSPAALRGRYQGIFSMVWGVAWTLAPVLGGQLMHRAGAPVLWWLCLGTGLLVAGGHLLGAGARRRRLAEVAAAEPVSERAAPAT